MLKNTKLMTRILVAATSVVVVALGSFAYYGDRVQSNLLHDAIPIVLKCLQLRDE